jgi:hypothetical protein
MQSLRLGDLAALEVYFYPPPFAPAAGQQAMTPQEVIQKVVAMMSRTGIVRSSKITLQDGTSFSSVPFGLERSSNKMLIKFALDGPEPPRIYPAEQIRSIE